MSDRENKENKGSPNVGRMLSPIPLAQSPARGRFPASALLGVLSPNRGSAPDLEALAGFAMLDDMEVLEFEE